MAQKPTNLDTIWEEKTIPVTESGCWLWLGSHDQDGYGKFSLFNKVVKAHAESYKYFNGPLTPGLQICHSCNVSSCVNPAHLYQGTAKQNAQDRDKCQRTRKGSKHGMSVLTEEQVLDIAQRIRNGETNIAKTLGISKHTISTIKRGVSWSWLTGFSKSLKGK